MTFSVKGFPSVLGYVSLLFGATFVGWILYFSVSYQLNILERIDKGLGNSAFFVGESGFSYLFWILLNAKFH